MFLVWQQGSSSKALEEGGGLGSNPAGERRVVVVQLPGDRCSHSVPGRCLTCDLSQHQFSGWCIIRHPNVAKQHENAFPFAHSSDLLGKFHIPAELTPVYRTSDANTVPLLLHSLSVEALSLGPGG